LLWLFHLLLLLLFLFRRCCLDVSRSAYPFSLFLCVLCVKKGDARRSRPRRFTDDDIARMTGPTA